MAERRMFAKTIIDSDAFLDMPQSTQLLYFHLAMRADDDGFVNSPKTIMRIVGAKTDDLNVLFAKKFLIPFDCGIVVIKHWRIHNYIQKDRYKETKYLDEKNTLFLDENNAYTQDANSAKKSVTGEPLSEPKQPCIQDVYNMDTQVRLELGKGSIELDNNNNAGARTREEDDSENDFVESEGSEETESQFDPAAFNRFIEKWGIQTRALDNYSGGKIASIDWDAISAWVEKSSYLQQQKAVSFYVKNANDIMDGKYFDYKKPRDKPKPKAKQSMEDSRREAYANAIPGGGGDIKNNSFWQSDYAKKKRAELEAIERRNREEAAREAEEAKKKNAGETTRGNKTVPADEAGNSS